MHMKFANFNASKAESVLAYVNILFFPITNVRNCVLTVEEGKNLCSICGREEHKVQNGKGGWVLPLLAI